MTKSKLTYSMLGVFAGLLGMPFEADARPITVTDPNCANLNVATGDTITLETDLTIDSDGFICVDIRNVKRVKLKLNGHTINVSGGTRGVFVTGASSSIQILGPGKIEGFSIGVEIINSTKTKVSDILLAGHSEAGIEVDDATDVLIGHNIVFDNASGIRITGFAETTTVTGNEVFGNNGAGISLDMAASDNIVELNNISSNAADGIAILDTAGINNVIDGNIVLLNGEADIDNDDAPADIIVTNNICEVEEGAPVPGDYCPVAVSGF